MAGTDWLRLGLVRGLHGHRLTRLLEHFGSTAALLSADRRELMELGLSTVTAAQLRTPDRDALEAGQAWLDSAGHRLLSWADADYPPLLRKIPDPPIVLWLRGHADALQRAQLAVVGSRKATHAGLDDARCFAARMAGAGLAITSGLARGIDGAAHEGTLDAGGVTVAVCGTGPERVYPACHRQLAERILDRGAVITEYPPGTVAHAGNFPRRNRIISGLALGTLVIEAGRRSGALITAHLAAHQGREVFAIPGSIHNPLTRGCHHLIRNGAKLVENVADIGEELGPLLGGLRDAIEQNAGSLLRNANPRTDDPQYRRLLSCLGWEPVGADELVARSGLTAAEVSSMLLMLELENRVRPLAGGRYQQREEGVHDERDRA